MGRLVAPDRACVGVDVGTTRYDGNRVDVTNPEHRRLLLSAGYLDPGPAGVPKARGYTCSCGFRGWFKTCGKCGAPTTRDN